MRRYLFLIIIGGAAIFASLAIWFHFAPVSPTPNQIEKKISLMNRDS